MRVDERRHVIGDAQGILDEIAKSGMRARADLLLPVKPRELIHARLGVIPHHLVPLGTEFANVGEGFVQTQFFQTIDAQSLEETVVPGKVGRQAIIPEQKFVGDQRKVGEGAARSGATSVRRSGRGGRDCRPPFLPPGRIASRRTASLRGLRPSCKSGETPAPPGKNRRY